MEAICSSETSVDTRRTTRRKILEDGTLEVRVCLAGCRSWRGRQPFTASVDRFWLLLSLQPWDKTQYISSLLVTYRISSSAWVDSWSTAQNGLVPCKERTKLKRNGEVVPFTHFFFEITKRILVKFGIDDMSYWPDITYIILVQIYLLSLYDIHFRCETFFRCDECLTEHRCNARWEFNRKSHHLLY
jgi:hypothetical protein